MKALCVGEGAGESDAQESALKLFKIRFADSDGRRQSASFLVQRRYAWRGYAIETSSASHPSRVILPAYDGDEVVATISIGLDSAMGLFVDALFGHELKSLRARGGRVCEFTKLAIDEMIKSKQVLAALFHTAYIQARRIGACTDLVVEVNPRHVRFYERMLGFRVFGSTRADPRVQAPATLLHLDLRHAETQYRKVRGEARACSASPLPLPALFVVERGDQYRAELA